LPHKDILKLPEHIRENLEIYLDYEGYWHKYIIYALYGCNYTILRLGNSPDVKIYYK
jgi:hypothetical protein